MSSPDPQPAVVEAHVPDLAADPAREALKTAFLAQAGFGAARRVPLAGDASTRAYERLHLPDGRSAIFMDQPPKAESQPCPPEATPEQRTALGYNASARLAAGRVDAFVAAAGWLRAQGLSAPEIYAHDAPAGLAVLEDLGDDQFASLTAAGHPEAPLYEAAVDVLHHLHRVRPPAVLEADGASWPLLAYDELALGTGADLLLTWWPRYAGREPFAPEVLAEWRALWAPVRAAGAAGAAVFAHRDYHAENLLWLPQRSGVARVGLLDFQDCLLAHPAWDLIHLLQDGRRDVLAALEQAMLDRYLQDHDLAARERFLREYFALGALNAARILFIFTRQVAGFGRPKYRALVPRMWGHLERNLQRGGLTDLAAWFDRHMPAEARA